MIDVWQAVLDQLDPARRVQLATPGELARYLNPKTRQTPALDLIDEALVEALNTPDGRLIISMPPQEGKSVRAAGDFPVFALLHDPDTRIVCASYGADLAVRNGRAIRRRITSNPELGLEVAADNGSVADWAIAGHTGGVFSVGIGGGVTGRPADLLIIDDPIKSRADAESTAYRERVWDWWTDEASARLAPGATVVVIMTRWHEDDLAGRLLERNADAGWKFLNIPAQCEDPTEDPLQREHGEFMLSARGRTSEQWEARKATAGARTWAALYQGRPSPADGDVFQREHWRHWARLPDLDRCKLYQSWDLAFTGSASSDYVVGQVWAHEPATGRHYLLDQVRGRWSFTETIEQMLRLTYTWPAALTKLVESKANGAAAIDTLTQRGIVGIVPVVPREGKVFRAEVVAPVLESHHVILPLPSYAPWVGELIEEAAAFPNAKHDDQVDALTQYLSHAALPQSNKGWSSGFVDMG
ncbi:phage terminase large subunit [Micrococcus antarcticus]|uniref:phage terminase large subunit n=1 Tax=Micrococcus antarcticus TaxID=86171 RepID=UPI00384CAAD5